MTYLLMWDRVVINSNNIKRFNLKRLRQVILIFFDATTTIWCWSYASRKIIKNTVENITLKMEINIKKYL